jgi:hypothetical protein
MSLSFDLIEHRRRALERNRRMREAQQAILGWVVGGIALAALCAVFAYIYYGFFFIL